MTRQRHRRVAPGRTCRRRTTARAALVAAAVLLMCAPGPTATAQDPLERERLRLEVERLRRETGPQSDAQRWLPAGSVLVALAVAAWGVVRYRDERRREQAARTEEAVAHNVERLIDRPAEGTIRNARAVAALFNLEQLARSAAPDRAEAYRVHVTDAAMAMVVHDLTAFHTHDDARLPVVCADRWDDFERRLRGDPEACRIVLERYLEAIAALERTSPPYLRTVRSEARTGRYEAKEGRLSAEDALFLATLLDGFERYVDLLPGGEARDALIERFRELAPALGEQRFGPAAPTPAPGTSPSARAGG
jgi:hypothetical protein